MRSASAKPEQQQTAAAYASVPTEADKRSSVPYMTTPSGVRYALPDKVSAKDKNNASSDTTEDQGVCIKIILG